MQPTFRQDSPEYIRLLEQERIHREKIARLPEPSFSSQIAMDENKLMTVNLALLTEKVPQLVEFVRIIKVVNRNQGRQDTPEFVTQGCLAAFYILTKIPLEQFDVIDIQKQLQSSKTAITSANSALTALRQWSDSLETENKSIHDFMAMQLPQIKNQVGDALQEMEKAKGELYTKFNEAINAIRDLGEDSETNNEPPVLNESHTKDESVAWDVQTQVWISPDAQPKPDDPIRTDMAKDAFINYARDDLASMFPKLDEHTLRMKEQAMQAAVPQIVLTNVDQNDLRMGREDLSELVKAGKPPVFEPIVQTPKPTRDDLINSADRETPPWMLAQLGHALPPVQPPKQAFHEPSEEVAIPDPIIIAIEPKLPVRAARKKKGGAR